MRHTPSPAARPQPRRFVAMLALSGALSLVSGCLYRMDVQQGNFLDDPTQVMQLQEGMTRSQVKFLLGTPMVPNGFNADRWDYYYYEKRGYMKSPVTRRITVYFKDEKVERFDRPADTEAAAAAMAAAAATAPPPGAPAVPAAPALPAPASQP